VARLRLARRGSAWRLRGVLALAAVAAAAGCSTAPSGGLATQASGRSSQVQAYTLPLPPPPPTASWHAYQVVLGFLHASATYDLDPKAAWQYMTPQARKHWKPVSVTVVRAPTAASQFQTEKGTPHITQPAEHFEQVSFTGDRLATLSQSGQYQSSSGSASYQFQMVKGANGIWLIDSVPSNVLLLTQSDFQLVYQPRNLFFFAPPTPGTNGVLVPDPVFAPIQVSDTALNTGLATGLVEGLIHDRSNWLSGGTTTAFPAKTTLIGGQVIMSGPASAPTALVDLGGAAAQTPAWQRVDMAEQLEATLGDKSYSATPVATSVVLEINHKPPYTGSQQQENLVPEVYTPASGSSGPEAWYARTPAVASAVTQFGLGRNAGIAELSPGEITSPQAITALAVSPGGSQQLAVAVQDGNGCTLQVGPLGAAAGASQHYAAFPLAGSDGPCTSLSWTDSGAKASLWAVAGGQIWVLQAGQTRAVPVTAPVSLQTGEQVSRILALRMAPDSVRAALLVHTSTGNHLMLAAVNQDGLSFGLAVAVGTGLADPTALSWFDPYHLAVLAHHEIYEVPLTGSEGTELGGAPAHPQTLTSDGKSLVVGTTDGQLWTSALVQLDWRAVAKGSNPVFPG
jgi:hypothetical protein